MRHKRKKTDKTSENIDDFIDKIDIDLATLEKFGSALLVVGYILFIKGADLDILDTLNINETGFTATSVTLEGGKLILLGYIVLFLVADYRLREKIFIVDVEDESILLSPYSKLYGAYLISILVNLVRVEALYELDYINRNGETIV